MGVLLRKTRSYLGAGKMLHVIALLFALISIFILHHIFNTHHGIAQSAGLIFLFGFFFTNTILAELDARSRFQNYKQIKDHLYLYGYHERILRPMLKSMCQRDAALQAARELGLERSCAKYFSKHGYAWYHLIPDFVYSEPQFIFTKYFWGSTFFVPFYYPKVDFYSSSIGRNAATTFLS